MMHKIFRNPRFLKIIWLLSATCGLLIVLLWAIAQQGRGIGVQFRSYTIPRIWITESSHASLVFIMMFGDTGKQRKLYLSSAEVFLSRATAKYPAELVILIPYWVLATSCFASSYLILLRGKRFQKIVGRCATCGYDIRAHMAGEKCPECGNVIRDMPCNRN